MHRQIVEHDRLYLPRRPSLTGATSPTSTNVECIDVICQVQVRKCYNLKEDPVLYGISFNFSFSYSVVPVGTCNILELIETEMK